MEGLTTDWVGALASVVDLQVSRAVGGCGTTDLGALLTCLSFGAVSVGELGEVLGLTGSGAVRLVNRLEQDGLARRQAAHGRSVTVRLTARGRRIAAELRIRRLAAIEDLLVPLRSGERALLADLVAKVLHGAGLDGPLARQACRFCDHCRCDADACPIGRSLRERGEATVSARPRQR